MSYEILDLTIFDGAAAGAAGAEGGGESGGGAVPSGRAARGASPLAGVKYGKQDAAPAEESAPAQPAKAETKQSPEERKAEFERMIKGEWKEEFGARTQQIINERFAKARQSEEQMEAMRPMLDMLAQKYGVDGSDYKALSEAIQSDDSYYEQEAMAKGLTVKQLKEYKRLERENAEFRRTAEERQRQADAQRIYAEWQQQADATKQYYPQFDLRAEINGETGERFTRLLRAGVDVRTAYEVIHSKDIIGGAMQMTAQKVAEKTVNDIRARGMRPQENGGNGGSPGQIVKSDPTKFTRADREEIARRARRGEKITF